MSDNEAGFISNMPGVQHLNHINNKMNGILDLFAGTRVRVFIMTLSKSEQRGSVDTSVILVVTLAACWDEPHVQPCLEDASYTNHTARYWGQHAHPGIPL